MEYKIYRFHFTGGVHFGKNSLDGSGCTFAADTLFSALCQEAGKREAGLLDTLVDDVKNGGLLISDAFPYWEKKCYLPKPMLRIPHTEDKGNSVKKKLYKRMEYLPLDSLEAYLEGGYLPGGEREPLGTSLVKVSAAVRGEEETRPYRVGVYYFNGDNGLYILAGFRGQGVMEYFEELLDAVSLSGIGGKRSAGLGRFHFYKTDVPEKLMDRLLRVENGRTLMTLSVSLPREEELGQALEGASYLLQKRSGFVASEDYAPEQRRKRDLYVFQAGSCFQRTFSGDVYDVSSGGSHPVYRYAKPMFLGVKE